jgi:glycosyltransferase involved in cell wall biosynthesis
MTYAPQSIPSPLGGELSAATAQPAAAGVRTVHLAAASAANPPALTVIVPTKNESANVEALLARVEAATAGTATEIIFVDDSTDETPQVVEKVANRFDLTVKLLARPPERRNGLGKAVVEGMRVASADWVCVMDGDLQHPPEVIPQLLTKAQSSGATLVAASRLREGGGLEGLSPRRRMVSQVLAATSRAVFPRRLRAVTDPLTGFFLVWRKALVLDDLQPEGFKILLEILVRTPALTVEEVPFAFATRHGGESKANSAEFLRFTRQMTKLAVKSQQQLLRFIAVGLSGVLVNTLLLWLFTEVFAIYYLASAVLATQGSTLWNFAWTEAWVFQDRPQRQGIWLRALGFLIMNNLLLLFRGPMLAVMVEGLGMHYVTANLVAIALLTLARFAVADRIIWRFKANAGKNAYYYDIHGIIRVRSEQRLPELTYFQSKAPLEKVDIDVKVDGNMASHRRPDSIFYEESPGRFGFAVVINRSDERTEVVASPLVAYSPHVLYTNVVEALLRWTFVRKGYALMHGASIAQDENALFITARTDTGKTTTILRTMREDTDGLAFLSDDMTILSEDGVVRSYPKPLTISSHTLRAVGGAPLHPREKAFLQLQSRLHSRSGRRFAMLISTLRLPAATINAIVQILVPPPKFMIDRLIPQAQYARTAKVAQIVVIERGGDYDAPMTDDEKFSTLIANAEDAYGFPPYPQLKHLLSTWEGTDLHVEEQRIVTSAVQKLPATRMGSTSFNWHQRLPKLAASPTAGNGAAAADPHWVLPEYWGTAGSAASAD